jgi:hypothetical protein
MNIFDQTIPQEKPTRVFYKFNTADYIELKFVKWTPRNLVVMYPSNGFDPSNKQWRMGRKLVNRWMQIGVLKIEGEIPPLALSM